MDKVKEFLSYLVRVSFGTTLVASVVIVYTTIFALLSSQRDDRNDRRSSRGGGMMFFGPRFTRGIFSGTSIRTITVDRTGYARKMR